MNLAQHNTTQFNAAPHSTLVSPRINARLDETTAGYLKSLTAQTGLAISDIVRESLALYYQSKQAKTPAKTSKISAMIGQYGSQPSDAGLLSRDYKDLLTQSLSEKHSKRSGETPVDKTV